MVAPTDHDALLNVDDVAALLRMSAKAIYNMVELRRVPFVRLGRRVRFRRADVLAWVEAQRVAELPDARSAAK